MSRGEVFTVADVLEGLEGIPDLPVGEIMVAIRRAAEIRRAEQLTEMMSETSGIFTKVVAPVPYAEVV